MDEQIIRNCVLRERLERGLAEYHARRTQGLACPDLLPPEEREGIDRRYYQRLQNARLFMHSRPQSPQASG